MKLIVTLCCALLLTAVTGASARSSRGSRNHQPAAQSAEPKVIDIAAIARAQAAAGAEQGNSQTAASRPEPSLFRRVILPSGSAAIVCLLTTGTVLYFLRRRNLLRLPAVNAQRSAVSIPAVPAVPVAEVPLPVIEPAPVRMRTVSRFSQIDEPAADGPVDLVRVAKMLGVGIGELKLAVHLRTFSSGRHMNEVAA